MENLEMKIRELEKVNLTENNDIEIDNIIIKIRKVCAEKIKNDMTVKNIEFAAKAINITNALSTKEATINYFITELKQLTQLIIKTEDCTVIKIELLKYCNRVAEKGFYKRKDYTIKVIKKVLGITDTIKTKEDIIQLNKEILNQDFSARYSMIISSLRATGTKKEPVRIENKKLGAIVSKIGGACDEQDLVLFDFLLGQFIESNYGNLQLVKRQDLLDSLNMDTNKQRIEKMMLSLSNLASQVVMFDDDKANDKVKKILKKDTQIQKKANDLKLKGLNLFTYEAIEVDGSLTIQFKIPLVKYLSLSNHFGRYINADVMKHWSKKPRVYWIAKELAKLCRMNESNGKKIVAKKISIETLLKNINHWDRYKNYQNKRLFLNRLFDDIKLANTYLKNNKISFVECSPSTLKMGRIEYIE